MKRFLLTVSIMLFLIFSCSPTKKMNSRTTKFYQKSTPIKERVIDIDTTIIGKRFSGKVVLSDHNLKEMSQLSIELFYLLSNNKTPDYLNSKEIFRKNTYFFDFIISNKDLDKYTYISFTKGNYDTLIPIKSLKEKGNIIKLKRNNNTISAKKPIIYLYPQKKEKVTIIHNFKGKILATYPQYDNAWNVTAYPNGKIYNHKDNRYYNYLFWEGEITFPHEHYVYKNGFIVEKSKIITFLQANLEKIGLNNREINDFVAYWIPELSKHNYYFIHFRINDNIDNTSFMEIYPKPETFIRVFMEFKGFDDKLDLMDIKEQKLPTIKRKGFIFIEWGGAEINNFEISKNNS